MKASDVASALDELRRALGPHTAGDWTVRAGDLDWSCRDTAVHIAHDLLAYAAQLAGATDDGYLPLDLTVRESAGPAEILRVVAAAGTLLATQLRAAEPTDRAWHWGPTDPSGFAALGVNEILLHTYDIARGLRIGWRPPAAACAAVLARLFPDHPAGDPVQALLWCTGRIALPDLPRRTSWTLRAAVE
ncbi:maleylpyruvate isomerase N-terminal domain-containing protein [Actinoplanes oblitus]|uniref:Maleylpyruvate isomerase N-terminal domain-containing protein n=1 Tax=Actinoplanes oblitus TaxID=3040509 RepID=A0ABY8WTX4_9ACTN|nr:maleylpyruvate isomerase N-terminal domain-containing protein [Actinoplanes oblitus]WIM99270.1 maleylpyruvate isomerase N-terminal domain-containing protein [Actinoplanes oblitus]